MYSRFIAMSVLFPFMGAALYMLAIVPFGLAISLLGLFFGAEYGFSAFDHEVSVEASPPGAWLVHQLPLSSAELEYSLLAHSTPEDPRVPPLIAAWILGMKTTAG
jgi:hypothetical protein